VQGRKHRQVGARRLREAAVGDPPAQVRRHLHASSVDACVPEALVASNRRYAQGGHKHEPLRDDANGLLGAEQGEEAPALVKLWRYGVPRQKDPSEVKQTEVRGERGLLHHGRDPHGGQPGRRALHNVQKMVPPVALRKRGVHRNAGRGHAQEGHGKGAHEDLLVGLLDALEDPGGRKQRNVLLYYDDAHRARPAAHHARDHGDDGNVHKDGGQQKIADRLARDRHCGGDAVGGQHAEEALDALHHVKRHDQPHMQRP